MKRTTRSIIPDDCLDKWLIKGLLEDLKDQTRVDSYEFDSLWAYCEEQQNWLFDPCLKHIVTIVSEKEKESGKIETQFMEVINDTMYIRPGFKGSAYRNNPENSRRDNRGRARERDNMRKYGKILVKLADSAGEI